MPVWCWRPVAVRRLSLLAGLGVVGALMVAPPAWAATSHTAYVASTGSSSVTPIDTQTNTPGTTISAGSGPQWLAITPNGKTAYVSDVGSGTVIPIDTATNTAGTPIPVGDAPEWVAITPDGKTAYVTDNSSNTVTPIDTQTNKAGPPIPVGTNPAGIAITPDQPPSAAFGSSAQAAGQATGFDASSSSDPDGSVASYHWDFGDGSSETTASARTTHTYASAGNYTVTLMVSDNEGCSTSLVFTGQTASCPSAPGAAISHQVSIAKATPAVSTSASAAVKLGGSVHDTATLSAGHSPGGTIVFKLFGPTDSSCSATPAFTSSPVAVSGNGSYSSPAFTPTRAGSYRWTAQYSGDANNNPVSSACNATGESVSIAPRALKLSVSPTHTQAGRRACFVFKATSTGHPVAGATVNLGHHTAKTSQAGRARICLALHRGTYHPTATKTGFRPARATITAGAAAKPIPRFTG